MPTNVRQRYLDSIIEECLKIYNKDESKVCQILSRLEINRYLHFLGFNGFFSKIFTDKKRNNSISYNKKNISINLLFIV